MSGRKLAILVAVLILVSASVMTYWIMMRTGEKQDGTVSLTVDGSRKYQVIEAFGGAGAYYEGLLRNLMEPKRTEATDLLFSDLGITMYRLRVWTQIEKVNDDEDPNHFNWSAFNFSTDLDQVWNALEAKKRGVTEFVASVWSPPAWMKSTGNETGGGYLLPEMYDEFAEWLAAYIIGYKNFHGIEISWISIQNEPDYTASWETCTYSPEQLRDVIKRVGAKFEREGINAKILMPETSGVSAAATYISTVMADPGAAKYVDIFAFHNYDTSFFAPDEKIAYMQAVARLGAQYGRPIWQTEYSYLGTEDAGTYKEAIYTVQHIHNVLTHTNASVYIVWELFWYRGTGLISIRQDGTNYEITPKYYAVKQFFKFIAPGSRRILATATNTDVLASAYINEENGRVTIIAINRAKTSFNVTVTLQNLNVRSFHQYRTSSSENCTYLGNIIVSENSLRATLPAESVTTLISG
ncbi:MAG: glycosyl hydrolase [Candidatus Bathyarchaeota archaeon]|nr:glycosyl hydrolase [Candidatus Bathyarchaeota archaeon]